MKNFTVIILTMCLMVEVSPAQTAWNLKASFPASARYSTSYFAINGKGYIGLGYASNRQTDLWEYDPISDTWTQKANFPAAGRNACASFAINNTGYVVAGGNGVNYTNDTYGYDQTNNTWSLKDQYPLVPPPQDCYGFTVGNKGYVVGGWNGSIISNMYEYDPVADSWSTKAAFPGGVRSGLAGFVIDFKAYIGTGYDGSNQHNDFYCYDPAGNSWTQKANVPGSPRGSGSAFAIGNTGYLGLGSASSGVSDLFDFYSYNYISDTWSPVASYPGSGPAYSACFAIGNKGYVGTGGYLSSTKYTNFYEFTNGTGVDDIATLSNNISVWYAGEQCISIDTKTEFPSGTEFFIYDLNGKLVNQYILHGHDQISVNTELNGICLYSVRNGNKLIKNGKILVL